MAEALAVRIKKKEWELVALYLLLGTARALESLPPDSLTALLDLLGEADGPQ